MNLINGVITDSKQSQKALENLEERILKTLEKGVLSPKTVIDACDRLVKEMEKNKYLEIMLGLGMDERTGKGLLQEAKTMFSKGYLEKRLVAELGEGYLKERSYIPPYGDTMVCERFLPLGVLLHIAAGNVDGLPAFSVLEGLMTGNINILKLPEVDGGISVMLLSELINIEPKLSEYIYVFDYSSKDEKSISKLIEASDAVVVWGGDAAVSAIRNMAGPLVKVIEWGHKVGFAYVTKGGINDEALYGLAHNICRTNQLLCSSCQGVFLDTGDMEEVLSFSERFLPILDEVSEKNNPPAGIGIVSQVTLELYNKELESLYDGSRIFRGKSCSVTASTDSNLDVSIQFRNPWVKRLPRKELLKNLRPHKSHLQTAALLCGEDERPELTELLSKTGLVRITDGERMSSAYCGEAHDGEYPLRRYTKVFSVEYK